MADKLKVSVSYKGVGQLLKSQELLDGIGQMAKDIAARAGTGYGSETKKMGTRVIASAYTDTPKAMTDNARNNTLLKAVQE